MKLSKAQVDALRAMAEWGMVHVSGGLGLFASKSVGWVTLLEWPNNRPGTPRVPTLEALATRKMVTRFYRKDGHRTQDAIRYAINDAGRAYLAALDAKEQQP